MEDRGILFPEGALLGDWLRSLRVVVHLKPEPRDDDEIVPMPARVQPHTAPPCFLPLLFAKITLYFYFIRSPAFAFVRT